jgi:hypothetical protein
MRCDWIDWNAARTVFSSGILMRSLVVAIVVGTVLNAINQGAEIVGGQHVNLLKLLLTYSVPFMVSSHGAYSALTRLDELTMRDRPD